MAEVRKLPLRILRNRLIDQVMFPQCATVPIRDLALTAQNTIVVYEHAGRLYLTPSQENVQYELFTEDHQFVSQAKKNKDGQIYFDTMLLTDEDYTFYVKATNLTSGLSRVNLQTINIKVGVDVDLPVSVDNYTPLYNTSVNVFLSETQPNNTYQLFDGTGQAISEVYNSNRGGDLQLQSIPLKEDTRIKIKAINLKTKQEGILLIEPFILVYPDEQLTVHITTEAVDYNTAAQILIEGAQASTDYQLIWKDLDDDTVDKASLYNTTVGKAGIGKGADLILKTTNLKEDLTVVIRATKRDSKLTSELRTNLFVMVRPDPAKNIVLEDPISTAGDVGAIRILKAQRGIYYQLYNKETNEPIGWRRYYHKNYGIGKARVGIELAVDLVSGEDVILATGPIDKNTEVYIQARKATTGQTANLTQTKILTIGE